VTPNIISIVPIKKNSKRLPNKNFRDFNGKPLYHWILETLESVDQIDKIVVNTNSETVIESAPEKLDVEISERPERFYDDRTTENIIAYEVDRQDADIYVQTYCTNPLLQAGTIAKALNEFLDSQSHDSLFTPVRHQAPFYDENLESINHDPQEAIPFQDLPPVYEDVGNMFIYTDEAFKKTHHRLGENPMIFELDKIEAIDIDTKDEFDLAEYFHKKRNSE
jgi:CMP-N-acetylneuraminic acid synthetase